VGQEDFVPDLRKIHAAGKHLLALINDVLDPPRWRRGKLELVIENVDIVELVNDVSTTVVLRRAQRQRVRGEVPGGVGNMLRTSPGCGRSSSIS
jgi:signal transduction histidine kinase